MKAGNISLVAQRLNEIEKFMEPLGGSLNGAVRIEQAVGHVFVDVRLCFSLEGGSKCAGKSALQEEGNR
jgi:hypothetical protein